MNDMMGKRSRNRKGQTCCGRQRGTSKDKLLHKLKEKPIIFNFAMVSCFLNLKAVLYQLSCVIHFYYNSFPSSFNFLAILLFLLLLFPVCDPFTFFVVFCLLPPPISLHRYNFISLFSHWPFNIIYGVFLTSFRFFSLGYYLHSCLDSCPWTILLPAFSTDLQDRCCDSSVLPLSLQKDKVDSSLWAAVKKNVF